MTSPPAEPERIGDLLVERVLGEGGMGRVLLCKDTALDRHVAVKTLLPALLHDDGMRQRFLREAKALARVKSENVVTIHAVGEDARAGPYVVMDLLDGDDVLALLHKQERLDIAFAVRIAAAACTGLAAAHDAGLLHRDVKPANLFVTRQPNLLEGRVVLTDFGLAKDMPVKDGAGGAATPASSSSFVPAAQLTQQGVVVGTPAYLAPELARGQLPSVASDLYALGATLFHLLAGRPPFEGDVPIDVLSKAVLEPAPRLSTLRTDIPAALDDAVHWCLHKDPRDRPQDALALRAALLASQSSQNSASTSSSSPSSSSSSPNALATQVLGTLTPASSSLAPLVSSPQVSVPPPPTPPTPPAPGPPGSSNAAFTSSPTNPAGGDASNVGRVSVKTAALTVMMTDIAGYTERTSRQSREEAARWLALHDALLQPVFRAFSGRVVKTIGDAFLVTFASPTDAVHCGMAVQDRLAQHNQQAAAADRIEVRVALSAGEVRLHKGDIFGEPVNLAARLEGLAKKGEVMFSDAVFSTMNQAEVKTEARGTHSFKGISRPVQVYAAVPDALFDPTSPTGALPFSGRFLGRVSSSGPLQGALQGSLQGAMSSAQSAMSSMRNNGGPLASRVVGGVVDGAGSITRTIARQVQRVAGQVGQRGTDRFTALPPAIKQGAVVVVVVTALVATFVGIALLFGGDRRGRIAASPAEAQQVKAEIEKVSESKRSPSQVVDLALAVHRLDDRKRAWRMLKKPIEQGLDDGDVLDLALADLAQRDDAGAVEALAAWSDDVSDDLRDLLDAGDYATRHHALEVLEQKKIATDDDRVEVGFIDVDEDDCGQRRAGLLLLKRSGTGPKAASAVKALGNAMPANLCMALEVGGAEEAIRKRSEKDAAK